MEEILVFYTGEMFYRKGNLILRPSFSVDLINPFADLLYFNTKKL